PRWELPAGGKVSATLAAGEDHVYAVRLVEGTVYDLTVTGKKGFVPHVAFLDVSRSPVATGAALTSSGSKTTLAHWTAPATATYSVSVTGVGAGTYSISSKGAPSKGGSSSVTIGAAGATPRFSFLAGAGATAVVTVKPAKGSACKPLVVSITDPQNADV